MKSIQKLIIIIITLTTFSVAIPAVSFGQIDPQIDDCPDNDPDVPCPIDGGLGFVLIAGAAYGIKKIRQQIQ